MRHSRLYPEPPHLELAVFHEVTPEERLLAEVCARLGAAGAVPTGYLEVIPEDLPFERPTDVGAEAEEIRVPAERVGGHLAGEVPGRRVLRAGFELRPLGLVAAGHNRGAAGRHPVALLTSAEKIESGWPGRRRGSAERVAAAVRSLMRDVCEAVGPLYASLGVETTLPGPERLAGTGDRLGDVFVAGRLFARVPGLAGRLDGCFAAGHSEKWSGGTYYSSWGPFNDAGTTARDPGLAARSGRLLGDAVARFARER
ncbi:hypothetical protein GCM10009678_20820 [Actinomadura kijaniata]|uniref:Uncharacterized protein n=1 Tax=Actinomadura namibiensis TaxID=182080 RepID=A0A7W3QJ22_ACTNM|nr:hypothetical protein [Actinomadura namibiensis]MBA8949064.1 hypothetical protein [Actinomadura namibiensis]